MIKLVDLFKQYKTITPEIDLAISEVIKSGIFIGGQQVSKFEKNFAKFVGIKYCIGVGNGTDALETAIEALGLPAGSEIIVPANTFIATAEAVVRNNLRLVFCDCDENNYTISISDLKKKISKKTAAIIAVHLYGYPCRMAEIKKIAGEKIKIIEDCAQAHGTKYKNKLVGGIGDIGIFSFFPAKNLGAYGDGGAIVTDKKTLALKCRLIANHGRKDKFTHAIVGRNSRLDSLQATILNVKLKYLLKWNRKRVKNAGYYFKKLANTPNLVLPIVDSRAQPVYHQFVVRHPERDRLKKYLENGSIEVGIHYPKALTQQLAFKKIGYNQQAPTAEKISRQILSLPVAEHLTKKELDKIISAIKNFK